MISAFSGNSFLVFTYFGETTGRKTCRARWFEMETNYKIEILIYINLMIRW
jgi:hypothetical protein